jgi:hypothetical protein
LYGASLCNMHYVKVHTSTYWYVPVYTGMYWYVHLYMGILPRGAASLNGGYS